MADMDQNAINQIIMDASSEDPTKKVDKLEKEVMILKGSIKKLIVDIREQMNNAENPFLNIQQLQMPATPPVIKEDPIQFEMPLKPDLDDEEEEEERPAAKSKKKPKKGKKKAAEVDDEEEADAGDADELSAAGSDLRRREQELLDRERALDKAMDKYGAASRNEDANPDGYSKRDMEVMNEFEEQRRMLETMRNKTRTGGPATLTGSRKIDPYTINQIMDWTRNMIRKNGSERLNDLLEMYVSTGYLSEETKLIVQRMSKLMESEPQKPPKRLDIKECVSDLYTLYMILNPGDKELDSRMLNVLLNPEERY
ncbi:FlaD/FlaE family flagellar protein [Methanocella sp. MCL-LM]|uniref:FlaD/FlaE family flagellar protein n=1 Tax=Methanocella sp. MCL-LM TaxID=3412035 RepID=UPI003C749A1D